MKKIIKRIIVFLLIIILIYSTIKLVSFIFYLNKNTKEYDTLIEDVIIEDINEKENDENSSSIDFNKLLLINKDTIGWIQMNQNKVNYPIVKTKDNSYYLNHSFNKKYNEAGSIFMDYRNKSFDDQNVVLYGHSLLNGKMFGSLKDVFKDVYFDTTENNYIKIYNTNNELMIYQIFSYYIILKEEYYITTSFQSDADFNEFIKTIKKRSYKNFKIDVTSDDNLLTLSTCYGSGNTSKRKVIHAKRIK